MCNQKIISMAVSVYYCFQFHDHGIPNTFIYMAEYQFVHSLIEIILSVFGKIITMSEVLHACMNTACPHQIKDTLGKQFSHFVRYREAIVLVLGVINVWKQWAR